MFKVVPLLGTCAVTPIYDTAGKWQGTFVSSFTLSAPSTFLNQLHFSPSGQVLIMERSGKLVATSTQESLLVKPVKGEPKQLLAVNSKDTLTREIARQLNQKFDNFRTLQATKQLNLVSNHERQFVRVTPYQDEYGLDWLVVVIVPESDFMAQINANTRTTIMLCLAALVGSIGVGILTARWITQPILELTLAAQDIANGQWDKTIETQRADEVGQLANTFKKMTAQLQQSFVELKSLNLALAQSESKLNQILEAIPVGVSVHDITGKLIYANQTSRQLLGIETLPEAETEQLAEAYQVYQAGTQQLYPVENMPIFRSLRGERARVNDMEIRLPDRKIPLEVYSTPLLDGSGEIVAAIAAFFDITQRKQTEQLLAEYNRTLEAQVAERTAELSRANKQLRVEMAERELVEGKLYSSTQQVRTIFESITDIVLIIDEKKNLQVIPTKAIGWDACDTNCLNSIVEPFFQEDTAKIWFAKVQEVVETQQNIKFDYSLRIDNREVWLSVCISPLPDNSVVWVARDISDVYNELRLRIQVEQELRKQKELRETIYNESTDALFLVDPKTHRITDCNGRAVELFEVTGKEDLIGVEGYTLQRHPFTPEELNESIAQMYQKGFWSREVEYLTRKGKIFWGNITGKPVKIASETVNLVRITDISDQKLAEAALRQSEQRYLGIIQDQTDLIVRFFPDGTLSFVNEAYCRYFGITQEDFIGHKYEPVIVEEDREHVNRLVNSISLENPVVTIENRVIVKSEVRWTQWINRALFDEQGRLIEVQAVGRDISDKKLAEESLRHKEEQLRLLTDALPVFISYADTEQRYQFVNKTYEAHFGMRREEICGRHTRELIGETNYALVRHWIEQALAGEAVNYEVTVPNPQDGYRHLSVMLVPDFDLQSQVRGYYTLILDLSDRKKAEETLREREEQLQLALEGSGDGFWDWNMQTGELYLSPRWIEMLGYKADELPQELSTWERLIHPDDKAGVMETLNAHLADSSVPYKFDYRVLTKSGEWKWIANYGKVVARDPSGAPLRMTGTHRDVSDRKLAEIKLQQAVLSAEAANRAKSAFLANMSHELRTPLNGILGYAQILQADKNCTPKQKKGVGIIHLCGTHLLTLINDILDLSKIEAGKLELYPEDFNFPSFLTSLSEIFQLKAIQKALTFTYLPWSELPRVIHADEKRLRQVLMNLLSNAVKFTDTGSVTFKVELATDDLNVSEDGVTDRVEGTDGLQIAPDTFPVIDNSSATGTKPNNLTPNHDNPSVAKVRFQVEDTGIGITPEQLDKIFLPFEQVGDSSRRAEGTGLGLAITQKIVALMGGKIFVESTPQVGSRFWFDLDVPVVSTSMNSTPVKTTGTIVGYSGARQKILIVDDRWENCAVLINILEPIGFTVEQAVDGQEGLEKALEFQPDLILADLVMPVMDGYEMTRQLRQFPELQNTIIIAISANAFAVDRLQSLEAGCNDFLPKPVQAEDLLDKIKSYLNLSWIYHSQSERESQLNGDESSRYSQKSTAEMVIPPNEELLALYEAANTGYVQGVEQELIRLQQLNPDYSPFATKMLEFAADFEYEEIANFIDCCLSESPE